jgi:small redox-active disulfide protein 2
MLIQILGTGCPKCNMLYRTTREALDQLGLDAELEKVEDINRIVAMGVMLTPALAIDGSVKFCGKAPGLEELKKYLQ